MTRYKIDNKFPETIILFITKNLSRAIKSYITGLDSNSELASSSWTVNWQLRSYGKMKKELFWFGRLK